MSLLHPGGTALTDEMLENCSLPKGARFLDLGCGRGESAAHIAEKYALDITGADVSDALLEQARAAHPDLNFVKCDGMTLDFPSCSFDGAMIECSFSLMKNQEEILHELYCILKPGAPLVIADLYMLRPDMDRARENCIEAQKHRYGQTGNESGPEQTWASPFCLDGMFVKELLLALLEDTGFLLHKWEDRTRELRNYAAQLLMDYGSLEEVKKNLLPRGEEGAFCRAEIGKNTGYFTLLARRGR